LLDRRQLFALLAGTVAHAAAPAAPALTLGFSTYGMPKVPIERAITTLAGIGFDSIELAVLPDRDTAPGRLDAGKRKEIRKRLKDAGLKLTALMESLVPAPQAKVHEQTVERLKQAVALAHDLAPGQPPLVETVLGGGVWERVRGLYRDRV